MESSGGLAPSGAAEDAIGHWFLQSLTLALSLIHSYELITFLKKPVCRIARGDCEEATPRLGDSQGKNVLCSEVLASSLRPASRLSWCLEKGEFGGWVTEGCVVGVRSFNYTTWGDCGFTISTCDATCETLRVCALGVSLVTSCALM